MEHLIVAVGCFINSETAEEDIVFVMVLLYCESQEIHLCYYP